MPNDHQPDDRKIPPALRPWQHRLHEVIFEADTTAGKVFDVALLATIVLSVLVVMLDSVEGIRKVWGGWFLAAEWLFTILFTIEYVLRLVCVGRPWRYALSFFGLVDLLAILPTYLSIFFTGAQSMLVIRTLRLLRAFRVLKLPRYLAEARGLMAALRATRQKITVFLVTVLCVVLIVGSAMYLIEGPENGFTSIPISVYWAVVTMTTVGYGDIAPQTVLGQALAAVVMILGYSLIIVPTGVFSVEVIAARQREISTQACPSCSAEGHDSDAVYCKYCGAKL
jgi:voltage-gated potassium channel